MVGLIQKLFIREVVGEVTEIRYANRGIAHEQVTLYRLTDDEGVVYLGGLPGYHIVPRVGDRVLMHLEKGSSFAREYRNVMKTKPDGTVEFDEELIIWEPIRDYKIL